MGKIHVKFFFFFNEDALVLELVTNAVVKSKACSSHVAYIITYMFKQKKGGMVKDPGAHCKTVSLISFLFFLRVMQNILA